MKERSSEICMKNIPPNIINQCSPLIVSCLIKYCYCWVPIIRTIFSFIGNYYFFYYYYYCIVNTIQLSLFHNNMALIVVGKLYS